MVSTFMQPVELEVTRMHLWGRGEGAVVSTCMRGRGALEVTRMHLWGREGAVVSTCMQGRGALEATRMHLTRPRASNVGDACLEGADRSGPSAVGTLELHKE